VFCRGLYTSIALVYTDADMQAFDSQSVWRGCVSVSEFTPNKDHFLQFCPLIYLNLFCFGETILSKSKKRSGQKQK
jgi:hypothetical protein